MRACEPAPLRNLSNDDGDINENGNFRLTKKQLCTFITLFCTYLSTYLCRHCTTRTWMPNLTFCEGREHKTTFFFFLNFGTVFKSLTPERRIKRDRIRAIKFEAARNSLFKWRFRSRRRHCCLSSLFWRENEHDSRRHFVMSFSPNVVVAETSYQMLEIISFCKRERA